MSQDCSTKTPTTDKPVLKHVQYKENMFLLFNLSGDIELKKKLSI